jgi:hypothetical protein
MDSKTSLSFSSWEEELSIFPGMESGALVNREQSPERQLVAATLIRAICDAFGGNVCQQHIVREAKKWLFSKKKKEELPFSFFWVTEILDIDGLALQEILRESQPDKLKSIVEVLRS